MYVRDFKNTNNHLLISVNQQVAVKIEPEYTLGMPDGELTEIASNFRIPNLGAIKNALNWVAPKKANVSSLPFLVRGIVDFRKFEIDPECERDG